MRCPNCGYFSFDYLDQCVKCRTDLTGERKRLHLPEIKPNSISFLEIMERMPIITQQERKPIREEATIKAQRPVEPQKSEVDLSQGLSLDILIPSEGNTVSRSQNKPSPSSESLELILEGLELNNPSGKKGN